MATDFTTFLKDDFIGRERLIPHFESSSTPWIELRFDGNGNDLVPSVKDYEDRLTTTDNNIDFPTIDKVIFNDSATIVWFGDGTKVIVKKSNDDMYSKEHALLYAIAKRLFGKVLGNGDILSNGFMTYLKKIVANGIDQPELAKKAAAAKKAKKSSVPENHPKTKAASTTTDSSIQNVVKQKYYAKKSNARKN